MTNHHVIATFPGAGIEVLKILNTSIISRHPAIGFVVTEGELDIGHGFKPSSHNWTRPVTAEGVVVSDYALSERRDRPGPRRLRRGRELLVTHRVRVRPAGREGSRAGGLG